MGVEPWPRNLASHKHSALCIPSTTHILRNHDGRGAVADEAAAQQSCVGLEQLQAVLVAPKPCGEFRHKVTQLRVTGWRDSRREAHALKQEAKRLRMS